MKKYLLKYLIPLNLRNTTQSDTVSISLIYATVQPLAVLVSLKISLIPLLNEFIMTLEKAIINQQNLRREAAVGEEINVIGIDEIAVRKGRIYETVLTDLDHGGVLGMNHDRSHQSVMNLLKHHSVLSLANIQTVVMDMWDPFHKAIRDMYPSVNIIIDKYHVVQKVTQALDQVRKELQKETPYLKNKRLIF